MSVRPHPKQHTGPEFADAWIVDVKGADGKRRQFVERGPYEQAVDLEQSFRIRSKKPSINVFPAINEIVPLFKESYQIDHRPRGYERIIWSLKQILPFFGRYQFQSITPALIEQYKRKRIQDGVKPITINKELTALSSLCRWAHEMGYCEEIRIKRYPPKMTRSPIMNVPDRKTVVRLLRAIPRQKRPAFCGMYYLGLRSQEAKDMLPEHVFWQRGVAIVTGKGDKQRIVPINRKVAVYVRHLPWYAPNDFRQIIKWACKRSGIDQHINPHLFRHAFGCHMTAAGVSLRALQEMMGHSSSAITERYSQVMAETLIKEMGKFR